MAQLATAPNIKDFSFIFISLFRRFEGLTVKICSLAPGGVPPRFVVPIVQMNPSYRANASFLSGKEKHCPAGAVLDL
jgi:hypothetical protein